MCSIHVWYSVSLTIVARFIFVGIFYLLVSPLSCRHSTSWCPFPSPPPLSCVVLQQGACLRHDTVPLEGVLLATNGEIPFRGQNRIWCEHSFKSELTVLIPASLWLCLATAAVSQHNWLSFLFHAFFFYKSIGCPKWLAVPRLCACLPCSMLCKKELYARMLTSRHVYYFFSLAIILYFISTVWMYPVNSYVYKYICIYSLF